MDGVVRLSPEHPPRIGQSGFESNEATRHEVRGVAERRAEIPEIWSSPNGSRGRRLPGERDPPPLPSEVEQSRSQLELGLLETEDDLMYDRRRGNMARGRRGNLAAVLPLLLTLQQQAQAFVPAPLPSSLTATAAGSKRYLGGGRPAHGRDRRVGSTSRRTASLSGGHSATGAARGVVMMRAASSSSSSQSAASDGRPQQQQASERLFWLEEERDACGVGFIANPRPEHKVVELGLSALGCMEHRGACLADNV